MAGLIDMLLNRSRFDQQNTLNNRMQAAGLPQQGIAPAMRAQAAQAQPVPVGGVPGGGTGPEAMIRRLRAARKAQQALEAQQFLQAQGGNVLTPQY